MKKLEIIISKSVLFGLVLLFSMCSKNEVVETEIPKLTELDENIEFLAEVYKVDASTITKEEEKYYIYSDLYISEERVALLKKEKSIHEKSPQGRQRHFTPFPSNWSGDVFIYRDPSLMTRERSAASIAISQLNAGLPHCFRLNMTNSKKNADIIIQRDASRFPECDALASVPTSTSFGPTVTTFRDTHTRDFYDIVSLLMHEIGHTLGLAHLPASGGGTLIPGTPFSDALSVMNTAPSGTGCGNIPNRNLSLSADDKTALDWMYCD